jgi:hypothetical protein
MASPYITNSTIGWNSSSLEGGGLCCDFLSGAVVSNTILWNNEAPVGSEIRVRSYSNPSTLTIDYSDVKDGPSSVVGDPLCTINWGSHMMSEDPLFVDSSNKDFHIFYNSPCRETGDNSTAFNEEDFEGDPRIAYGTVDIGADEFYLHIYYTGDAAPGNSVELKIVDTPGSSSVVFWAALYALETPIPCAYGNWYLLDPLIGPFPVPPIPSNGVFVLEADIPPLPPGPYDLYFQGIDWDLSKLTNLCAMHVK